jgi:multiple sugar transport system permease protein
MAPPIAFTIPFFLAYRWLGLLDTRTGLILIYMTFNLPLVIWMMQPFFDAVPASLEEAALMDGAGFGTVFMEIVMPMATAGIAATAILCFPLRVERLLLRAHPHAHRRAHPPWRW